MKDNNLPQTLWRTARAALMCLAALIPDSRAASAQEQAPPPAQTLLQNAEVTADGGINFYTTHNGKRVRSFAVTPAGSLIAGGVSRAGTPFTNEPPTIDPADYDKAGANGGRNWIHDFYFARFGKGDGQPRLYTRGLFLWGRGDSPDIQLGRTGPDNTENYPVTTYGPPTDTLPNTSLGKIVFVNWGEGQFKGDLARITARNDTVATRTKNPGSLHFATAGSSTVTNEKESVKAWRDGIDRVVIRSNGYVAIGDGFSGAQERLHVKGNIRADGNIVAQGAKKFVIAHPNQAGKTLTHASLEGPESAVYYRGEAQLARGRAEVLLPDYFEALTRREGRTVLLTNVDGFDRLAVARQHGAQVSNGRFVVISDNPFSSQVFNWEVKAIRADIAPLQIEE